MRHGVRHFVSVSLKRLFLELRCLRLSSREIRQQKPRLHGISGKRREEPMRSPDPALVENTARRSVNRHSNLWCVAHLSPTQLRLDMSRASIVPHPSTFLVYEAAAPARFV